MSNRGCTTIPKYDIPPVIEVVLGVEFLPLAAWDVPYFGLFWEQVREDFPVCTVKPPLGSQLEDFDRPTVSDPVEFRVTMKPHVRCWYVDDGKRRLMQIQRDRFAYNWRKLDQDDEYPHYDESVRPAFVETWRKFTDFTQQQGLGTVEAVQCHVSYVNHLEIGKGWTSAADIGKVFPSWQDGATSDLLPRPESVGFDVAYRIDDPKGRLRLSVKPAIRNADGEEILQFTATTHNKPTDGSIDSVLKCLDSGREWAVRGFTEFTSKAMHGLWKRSQ